MLDIGWSELLIIGVVALVVVGPKDLPKLLRLIGQWVGKLRRMAADFQGQVNEAIREAELDDVKKTVDDLKSYNPATMIKNEIDGAIEPIKQATTDLNGEMARIEAGLDPSKAFATPEPAAPDPNPVAPRDPTPETLGLPPLATLPDPVVDLAPLTPDAVPAEAVRPAEPTASPKSA